MTKTCKLLLLSCAALAAAPAIARRHDDPATQLAKTIGDRVAGKPTDCVSLSAIGSSQIIAGKAIVYHVGSRLYVNVPRSGADTLEEDDILVTRTSGSELCSIDTVNLVDRTSHFPRGFVSLGQFVPYERVRTGD